MARGFLKKMQHPVQHPWVILSTIIGLFSLTAGGIAAYSDIKSDIRENKVEIKSNSALDEQRYNSITRDIGEIKQDTRYIRESLDSLRYLAPRPGDRLSDHVNRN